MSYTISMRDFLIKFTAVPKAFIDKHIIFYDQCEETEFGILLSGDLLNVGRTVTLFTCSQQISNFTPCPACLLHLMF